MLQLFLGTCRAVEAMHHYVAGPVAVYPPNAGPLAAQNTEIDHTALDPNIEHEQQGLIHEVDHQSSGHKHPSDTVFDAEAAEEEEDEQAQRSQRPKAERVQEGQVQPWAHRTPPFFMAWRRRSKLISSQNAQETSNQLTS